MDVSKVATKLIGDKARWRAYKARVKALPGNYRIAVDALERYLMYFGPTDGDSSGRMFDDLVELFELASADGTAIREIVGDDPVEFVETFRRNYEDGGGWVNRERTRLTMSISQACGESE